MWDITCAVLTEITDTHGNRQEKRHTTGIKNKEEKLKKKDTFSFKWRTHYCAMTQTTITLGSTPNGTVHPVKIIKTVAY